MTIHVPTAQEQDVSTPAVTVTVTSLHERTITVTSRPTATWVTHPYTPPPPPPPPLPLPVDMNRLVLLFKTLKRRGCDVWELVGCECGVRRALDVTRMLIPLCPRSLCDPSLPCSPLPVDHSPLTRENTPSPPLKVVLTSLHRAVQYIHHRSLDVWDFELDHVASLDVPWVSVRSVHLGLNQRSNSSLYAPHPHTHTRHSEVSNSSGMTSLVETWVDTSPSSRS
jgi:hypothetical protein